VRPNFAVLDYGPEPFEVRDDAHPFFGVNHACLRSVLLELGGYREDRGLFGKGGGTSNDEELYRRALAAGVRIIYQPAASVQHLIPRKRCDKAFQRGVAWRASGPFFESLLVEPPAPAWALSLPRYFFRKPLDHLCGWLRQALRGNRSGAFYHELQALRFTGVIYHALRRWLRSRAAPPRAPLPSPG
jgi:hypothetical protein